VARTSSGAAERAVPRDQVRRARSSSFLSTLRPRLALLSPLFFPPSLALGRRSHSRSLSCSPRTALTSTVVLYGLYETAYVATFWAVYGLQKDQAVAIGIRNFNAIPLWLGGWILSWSGLQVSQHSRFRHLSLKHHADGLLRQAFLVAVESERKFMSARTANWIFLGVGALLVSLNLVRPRRRPSTSQRGALTRAPSPLRLSSLARPSSPCACTGNTSSCEKLSSPSMSRSMAASRPFSTFFLCKTSAPPFCPQRLQRARTSTFAASLLA